MRRYLPEILVGLALAGATLAIFLPACGYDFINSDDPEYVTENSRVRGGLSAGNISWALTTVHAANWHPLTWLSLQLDASLFGVEAWGFHLTNVLLHAASTVVLFVALRLLTGVVWRSAVVAGLFALHPLHVESVAWVAERKDTLSGLFWMLTLLAYAWYVRQPGPRRYGLVLLAFTLGLVAKPMLVTLPCVLLLLDYWPLRRLRVREGEAPAAPADLSFRETTNRQLGWWPLVREKLPLLALTACSCLLTWRAQHRGGAVAPLDVFPVSVRLSNAAVAYATYLYKMIWPEDLAAFYPHVGSSLPGWQLAVALLLLVALSALCLWQARRLPYLAVGWLWYVGTLVPVIGLVQVGGQALADRYTYIPLLGIFLALTWGGAELAGRWRLPRPALGAVALAILATCAVRTFVQLPYWHDSLTLWSHARDVTLPCAFTSHALAGALCVSGQLDEGIAEYRKAVRFDPRFALAHIGLGVSLDQKGERDESAQHFREALRLNPRDVLAHTGLAVVLEKQGQRTEALRHYEEAVRLDANNTLARNNLGGVILEKQGRWQEAAHYYQEAVRLDPSSASAHNSLGAALEKMGDFAAALEHYRRALRLDPKLAAAHSNLGAVLEKQGQRDEAIGHYQEALRLDRYHAPAHNNLGAALERQGQIDAALSAYREALRCDPEFAKAHYNLGTALARAGKLAPAISHFEKALRIEPGYAMAHHNLGLALEQQPQKALACFRRAVELAPGAVRFRFSLGEALAKSGETKEAEGQYREALRLATSAQQPGLIAAIQEQLRLCEARQVSRDPKQRAD